MYRLLLRGSISYLLLLANPLYPQAVNGTLVGTVTDSSGASVGGAKVTALEVNTGVSRPAETNASGNYSFLNLAPGLYTVSVELTGFRKAVRENVDVVLNSTVRIDLALQPGQVTEQIVVTADVPLLQTDRTDTGRKIEQRQMSEMPLTQNRNFQSLLNLVPGAARAQRNHSEFFNSNDSLQSRVNGQSRLANNVQFEGVDNNQRTGLLTALVPPIEALQSVDITTSNYDAELGRAGGAVTNVNLKSGSNDFHGSVYWFNKVSALNARRTDLLVKPPVTYNYAGATFGGAIIKNKTFFFADYLGVRDRLGKGYRFTIPTTDFRTGNLSSGPTIIYDPSTGNADGSGRTPFANNIIPAARISPIAAKLVAMIPNPTQAGTANNFSGGTTRSKDTDSMDAKVDHNFGANDRISVRFSFQKPSLIDPPIFGLAGGPANGGFGGTGVQKTVSAGINYTKVFNPTLITELRVGFTRYRNDAQNSDINTKASDAVGIKGINISPFNGGLAGFDISGYSNPILGYSASLPWIRFEQNWTVVNNWTKTLNNHTLKFGFDFRNTRDGLYQTQVYSTRGLYRFRSGQTSIPGAANGFANAWASFLLDQPNDYGRDLVYAFPEYLQKPLFTYIQDKWQLNKRVTIDIGMRHELYPPATPRSKGGFSNFNPGDNSLTVTGFGNNPANLGRQTKYLFFAPRVGISARLNEKTVIRAGFGISYMPFPDNSYAYNFPVRQNNAYNPLNSFVAAGRMADGFPAPDPFTIPSNGIIALNGLPASIRNQNFDVIPLNFREGLVQSYNFAIQRALGRSYTLDVAYVGNGGRRVPTVFNLNAGIIPGQGANGQPLYAAYGRTAETNLRFIGTSTNYNSLQVKFDRKFNNGFLFTTAYTWSKAIDYSNDNTGLALYINTGRNRARSDFDRRHMFNQSILYELPFGKGKQFLTSGPGAMLLGGWQVNTILTLMTGSPFSVTAPASTLNAPGNTQYANWVGSGPLKVTGQVSLNGEGTWFDTSSFATPKQDTIGNLGRNPFTGPGFFNADFSIFRRFKFSERFTAELRGESFNVTNTPQYANPDGGLANATFGKVTSAGIGNAADPGARNLQLGVRLLF
ncbi:carboxypeptidase regulatory-like domain-containing protein [Bryobacter aggregatus]|uniref:carboxypeptidase regulatory-like domain-containing protein n=1 Tax=Bryobacter aggregatus TaxID=360054 RepID=UPI0004E0C0CD|nr:carboxypeptidase regulatory-like domain-containing protein [Bryobacter aggregatus]